MGNDADESRGIARTRHVRGLRDIRTLGSLRRSAGPVGSAAAGRSRTDPERPRAWVFVKRPRFARDQGALLVDRLVEPDVEVFEEGQGVIVLAELPGAAKEDIEVHVGGDVLTLATKPTHRDRRRYYRELLLPFPVSEEGTRWDFRNGVLEMDLARAESPDAARRKES